MELDGFLALAEWRRTVAAIYARWRESATDPAAAWERWRLARDDLFRNHAQSPLPVDERARFGGLSYFSYDPAYRMQARVVPANEPAAPLALASGGLVELPSSGQESFAFRRIGQVHLSGPLAGSVLPVFWMEGYAGGIFLPFRDATSGIETYAAGRYLLDTVKGADQGADPEQRDLVLDFNLAYHPSCAYDSKWNCPLAPPQSRLSVPVRVGERLGTSG